MEGFCTGSDKSQIDTMGLEHQGGTSISVLFSPKLDDSARAFETVVFFSRPKDSFRYKSISVSPVFYLKNKVSLQPLRPS